MSKSFQLLTSKFVKVECCIWMNVQECWWDVIWYFTLDWSFYDISFSFRPCHYNDFLGFFDCVDSHCDCSCRNFIDSAEWFWSISSSDSVQIYQSCTTVDWWGWFIETYVSSSSNTKDLDVDTSIGLNFLLIIFTELCHLWSFDLSIRYVDIFLGNINVLEKIVPHVKVVWFRIVMFYWVIFIKIKGDDVFKW